jgi:hypothetical protein
MEFPAPFGVSAMFISFENARLEYRVRELQQKPDPRTLR